MNLSPVTQVPLLLAPANSPPRTLPLAAYLALTSVAAAQTSFSEVEPNANRAQSTLVNGIAGNDSITGASTGTSTTSGSTLLSTLDMYRVKTSALPLGIYRHTLTITSAVNGHTGTIRGLIQTNGVISTVDTAFQSSSTGTTPPRSNTWYAFGRQEEIYYSVTGAGATTAAYASILTTQPIAPLAVAGSFAPGNITVTTFAQGHTTDTEIYLYDATLTPVPLGHNDDLVGGIASSSTVTLNLAAGTYYVGVSNYNTANNQSDLTPNEDWRDGPVIDFPNAVVNSNLLTFQNVAFSVSDGVTTAPIAATKTSAFDIAWATFTVGNPSTPSTPFCFGDGTGTACPCANSGSAGNGCASSSFPAGAHLASSGVAGSSAGTDTLTFTATNLPGPGLLFQGTTQFAGGAGIVFGDGLLCPSGVVTRMGVVFPTGSSASWPGGSNPNPIHTTGATSSGDVRHYQVWYRDAAAFCTAATHNLTQGLTLTWGP